MTERRMWRLIESAGWGLEGTELYHDHEGIGEMFLRTLPRLDCVQLFEFISGRCSELRKRFTDDWLGRTSVSINVSDDGWSDLTAEVVGRGEKPFKTITARKLEKMAKEQDYHENFEYVTHALDLDPLTSALERNGLIVRPRKFRGGRLRSTVWKGGVL